MSVNSRNFPRNPAPAPRDAWLAVNLSLFFPGLGQFYAGNYGQGGLWIVAQFSLLAIALISLIAADGNTTVVLGCLFAAAILYIINLYVTFHHFYRQQPSPTGEKIPRRDKNPWFAVLLSRILPGLGQFYLQKAVLGGVFLGLTIVVSQIARLLPIASLGFPAIAAIASYHAYASFPQRRSFPSAPLAALLASLVFALGTLTLFLPYNFNRAIERFEIPSGSMLPTLTFGDRVFVRRNPRYRPQRGDIVVFRAPEAAIDPKERGKTGKPTYFIKRIIGLPGEQLSVANGRVAIDGKPLIERYLASPPAYQTAPQLIPRDRYWVLGDNRNDSIDSHVWGDLAESAIVGRAYKIYWPPHRSRPL